MHLKALVRFQNPVSKVKHYSRGACYWNYFYTHPQATFTILVKYVFIIRLLSLFCAYSRINTLPKGKSFHISWLTIINTDKDVFLTLAFDQTTCLPGQYWRYNVVTAETHQ